MFLLTVKREFAIQGLLSAWFGSSEIEKWWVMNGIDILTIILDALLIIVIWRAVLRSRLKKKKMSNSYFLTFCQHCDGSIEFPAHGLGEKVDCPHCGREIDLRELSLATRSKKLLGLLKFNQLNGAWIALLCVLAVCGTALFIYNDFKADKAKQQHTGLTILPDNPPQLTGLKFLDDEPVATPKNNYHKNPYTTGREYSDAEVGLSQPVNPTIKHDVFDDVADAMARLPRGAWASTLVPVAIENNLFRDPATGKLYRNQNGKIVQEGEFSDAEVGLTQPNATVVENPFTDLIPKRTSAREYSDVEVELSPLTRPTLAETMRQLTDENIAEDNRRIAEDDKRLAELTQQRNELDAYYDSRRQQRMDSYNAGIRQLALSTPIFVPPSIPVPVNNYSPNSLGNPYGAGSPYKPDGLMNPYSQYGSPYSSKSWQNPYATDTPKLYDSQGNYRGKLSSNPYDADSTANPYGKYGSKYSSESINNPYGAGNPYNSEPIYVVPSK